MVIRDEFGVDCVDGLNRIESKFVDFRVLVISALA